MRYFDKVNIKNISRNGQLRPAAKAIYLALLSCTDPNTHQCCVYIDTIAEMVNRCKRTVQYWINYLILCGLLKREFRISTRRKKMNYASMFTVYGIDKDSQPYTWLSENCIKTQKIRRYDEENCILNTDRDYIERESKETLKWEAELPSLLLADSNQVCEDTPSYDLSGIVDIMKPTAEYWLMKTGRPSLSDSEKDLLNSLANTHTPTRIQKEIDTAVERFLSQGKPMSRLNFAYIEAILKSQKSYDPDSPKPSKRHKKAAERARKAIEGKTVSEPIALPMSLAEAEQVIAEYKPEERKETRPSEQKEAPTALLELLQKMEEADPSTLKLMDYLHMQYPEYDEDELQYMYNHSTTQAQIWIRESFQIDRTCADCTGCKNCRVKKDNRPVISIIECNGQKVFTGNSGIPTECRFAEEHDEPKQADADLELKAREAGLTSKQATQTFDTYDHKLAGEEATVAKAMAIVAAKKKKNLILAGRAGAGKTHLATAIALEAVQHGRKAIVRSVPELLDELKLAHQNRTDPFGLMMKYKSVPCLVLDDLGKQRNTEATWDYLYQIIDYRYQHGLQTIVTTNAYNVEELESKWYEGKAEPLVSRILENGDWVTIREAEDYRLKKA